MPVPSAAPKGRPHRASLGARLAGYVVLAHDPSVPQVAADWWEICAPHYRSVVDPLRAAAEGHRAAADLAALAAAPADGARERALADSLDALLAAAPATADRLADLVAAADPHLLIDYHRGPRPAAPAAPVDLDTVLGWPPRTAPPAEAPRTAVVIPFRDRIGGARTRNLLACLAALRAQHRPPAGVAVTVVETDDTPRWERHIRPWADHYVFAPHGGHFNKSWAVNLGVRRTPGAPEWVCVLDADILVDDRFLERNLARAADGGLAAFLPYRAMHCLDPDSSHAAIRSRIEHGAPDVPVDAVRALVLREPPGAVLWARADVLHRIGGFDERFQGWGGEDDDVVARLSAAGRLDRFDDPLLHLAHPRPQMTLDGAPFNAGVTPGGWRPGDRYGLPDGPAAARAGGRP
jgi:hypothetical protein